VSSKYPARVIHVKSKVDGFISEMSQSAVVLTSSIRQLRELYNISIDSSKYSAISRWSRKPKLLVYVENATSAAVQSVFGGQVLKNITSTIFFKFFITEDENSIELLAASFYSSSGCAKLSFNVLNSFNKVSKNWIHPLQNYEHYSDFGGCQLAFREKFDIDFYIEGIDIRNKSLKKVNEILQQHDVKYAGVIPVVVEAMSRIGNFKPEFQVYMTITHKRSGIGYNLNSLFVAVIYHLSSLHARLAAFTVDHYYLVTPNELYSNYEKLVFPFDAATWLLFVLTLALTFGIILVLNSMPKSIKAVVFGARVNMPAYNALGIFFGIGQTKLPKETFSRCILLLFIFFCLIFRTCYQSMMFEFITTDMRRAMPETIEDLIEMNYTILVHRGVTQGSAFNQELINGRVR
jgi:hypothetical protein